MCVHVHAYLIYQREASSRDLGNLGRGVFFCFLFVFFPFNIMQQISVRVKLKTRWELRHTAHNFVSTLQARLLMDK